MMPLRGEGTFSCGCGTDDCGFHEEERPVIETEKDATE
jgi:hypothetical protein